METRWLRHLGPPAIAIALLGAMSSAAPRIAEGAGPLPNCLLRERSATATDAPPGWYRIRPGLDADGSLAGRRVELGTLGGPSWRLDLPPESFASGPVGGRIVVGADDGRRSRIRIVDAATGCAASLAVEGDVIRSAVLDPAGESIYEHRVDRATRADLGVWRRSRETGKDIRVLEPFGPDPDVGLVWATPLFWTAEADRLIVASCGELRCRLRWVGPDGTTGTVAGPAVGEPIGAVGGRVVAYRPCAAMPCAVDGVDMANGRIAALDDGVVAAALVSLPEGVRLATTSGDGGRLRIVDPLDGGHLDLDLPAGTRLLDAPWRADAGMELARGAAVVTAAGPTGASLDVLTSPFLAGELDR